MRRLAAPFMMLIVLAIPFAAILAPFAAYAKPTLLAREEITINEGDGINAKMDELVKKAVAKMEKHPCAVKAQQEKRVLNIGAKVSVSPGETQATAVFEVWSNDCD